MNPMRVTNTNRNQEKPGTKSARCILAAALALTTSVARGHESVLVFSKTAGFRHTSIADGITAIQALGVQNDFDVLATEDATLFTDAFLADYDAIVFLSTTGDILDSTQQGAFERYIQAGGGFVGIHAAADTEYTWPWYGGLIGAYFQSHPAIQTATIEVADSVHPSTNALPKEWIRNDEWYNFQANPRGSVHVLATLDEGSYTGGSMGFDHPIAWCHEYDGGRAWYTAGGHTTASFSEPLFLDHILGGIRFAAGIEAGDCGATIESNYEKVTLASGLNEPMELDVAPDGRVFFIQRDGLVRVYLPATQTTVTAAQLNVSDALEDGLLGIALDPEFDTNGWVYLMYSPAGAIPKQHVSRFTTTGDTLDLGSEQVLLEITTQRDECCHSSGSMAFDANGALLISTGDNVNPFSSNGFAPIDEQPGRAAWDAQGTSGDRNDLRGKILRIQPQPDGTYAIPAGNLFPADGSDGRPEVYVMGCRNPFRFSVDSVTGWLYWGDVGPDANNDDAARGPRGYDEINQTRQAGNFGWPYCIADNQPYVNYDFATGTSGASFDCANPVNDSPNNTGSMGLPPAQPAWIWYPYAASTEFPGLGTLGRVACAGPVVHVDTGTAHEKALPQYYEDTLLIYDWAREWIKEVKLTGTGDLLQINDFLPSLPLDNPIDVELGPDGRLYVLEYGNGQLSRIDYIGNINRSPIAVAAAAPASGPVPLNVQFSSAGSYDPDVGEIVTFEWDFTTDGSTDSTDPNPAFVYNTTGNFNAQLTVTDPIGNTAVANVTISAGNTAPVVEILAPPNGLVYDWGQQLAVSVRVTDAEDGSTDTGTINCVDVTIEPQLGHDDHVHGLGSIADCFANITINDDGGHDPSENLYYVIDATYTDLGFGGVLPLTGRRTHTLQPRVRQAEHFDTMSGVVVEDVSGNQSIGFLDDGDWIAFSPVNLLNIEAISFQVASDNLGGHIEVRADAPDGPLVGVVGVQPTGGWFNWTTMTTPVVDPLGARDVHFVFTHPTGGGGLMNVDELSFDATRPGGRVLYRINAGGPALPSADGSAPDWAADLAVGAGVPSPYVNAIPTGDTTFTPGSSTSSSPGIPMAVPDALFATERWDASDAPEMEWDFPIASGSVVGVRIYYAEIWTGITGPQQRVFDVWIEGAPSLLELDAYAEAGLDVGLMRSAVISVLDDNLDIDFVHDIQNPAVKGIEIIKLTNCQTADIQDFAFHVECLAGPGTSTLTADCAFCFDMNSDGDVDLVDFALWQASAN